MIFFTPSLAAAAKRIDNGTTFKVLLLLPAHLDYTTFKALPREKLAAELDVGGASVSRAMKELHELGIVEREGRGPMTKWRLSTDWGWNGDVDAFHAFRGGFRKPQLTGVKPKPIAAECILWKERMQASPPSAARFRL